MRDDLERLLEAEQERVSQLPSNQLPMMTAAAQTRLSWARTVADLDSLPLIYRDFMAALVGRESAFPYAVLTPTFAGFARREKEKLVFCLDEQFYIIERDGNRLAVTRYRLADLNYVEMGSILLRAWMRVSGRSHDGALTSTTLKFNAVTDQLFAPFLLRMRAAVAADAESDLSVERQKFDYLTNTSFKFRNFAARSIQRGEQVVDSQLQQEIRQPIVKLFGRSLTRLVATAHLCVLTDTELIIIRDDEDSPIWRNGVRYGGVWTYLPLDKITALSLVRRNADALALTIGMPHGDGIESLFAAAQQHDVERFLSQLVEWAPDATLRHDNI